MQTASQITRLACVQDAKPLATLFQLAYGDSSHPCQDAGYVRRFLQNERNIYFVGTHEGEVIAGMGITAHPWHDAFEWGLGVTHPTHRRAGLAETLMQQAHDTLYPKARQHSP